MVTKRRNRRCQQCGWCCRSLILDCNQADARREPRIAKECKELKPDEYGRHWDLNDSCKKYACHFLTKEGLCEIHRSKPLMCRRFAPNTDARCQHTTCEKGAD